MPGLPGVHTRRRATPSTSTPTPGPSRQWKLSWLCDFWDRASAYLSCPVVTCWPPAPWSLSAYCFNPLSALSLHIPSSLRPGVGAQGFVSYSTCSDSCTIQRCMRWAARVGVADAAACSSRGYMNPVAPQVLLIHEDFIYYEPTVTSYFIAAWWRHHFVLHVFFLSFRLWSKLPLMESMVPSLVFELVSNILLIKKSANVLAFRSHVILHQ